MNIDFFLAGFGKCGSTTLHQLLASHPDISLPKAKDQGTLVEQGLEPFKASLPKDFQRERAHKRRGYSSVMFSGSDAASVAPLLAEHYPWAKFLFVARDPVQRMESEYRELHRNGGHYGIRCPYTFGEALTSVSTLLSDSAYFQRIGHFRDYFPDEQIKLLFFEDYLADRDSFLDGIATFLGIDPFPESTEKSLHANRSVHHCFDSPELRLMRDDDRYPEVKQALNDLPARIVDPLFTKLGLRLPFGEQHVEWQPQDEQRVIAALADDAEAYLRLAGREPSVWPRMETLMNRVPSA